MIRLPQAPRVLGLQNCAHHDLLSRISYYFASQLTITFLSLPKIKKYLEDSLGK